LKHVLGGIFLFNLFSIHNCCFSVLNLIAEDNISFTIVFGTIVLDTIALCVFVLGTTTTFSTISNLIFSDSHVLHRPEQANQQQQQQQQRHLKQNKQFHDSATFTTTSTASEERQSNFNSRTVRKSVNAIASRVRQ
jgi:hypothetical protein